MMNTGDQQMANKVLVHAFCQAFYNDKQFTRAQEMMAGDFENHHPGAGAGAEATISSFRQQIAGPFPGFTLDIRKTVAEGDEVWTYATISLEPGHPTAISVDIWRISGGRLAEHWDVGQPIDGR